MDSLETIARNELKSETCVCGEPKQKMQSFGRLCYYALPKNLSQKLYKPFSDGYASIYDEAKDWLRVNTDRLKKEVKLEQGGLF